MIDMMIDTMEINSPILLHENKNMVVDLKARILIADMGDDTCRNLQNYLEIHDQEVQITNLANEIIPMTRRWLPNIIILSHRFCFGKEVSICQKLLTNNRTAHIPLIVLLDQDNRMTRLELLEMGVNDIIPKPFDLEELGLRIQSLVRLSTAEQIKMSR